MNELQAALKTLIADTFVLYFKVHGYHWNVEGKDFPQYHEFFGNLYEDLHGAIDPLAEELRALNAYAPFSLGDLYLHKTLNENPTPIMGDSVRDMLLTLSLDNQQLITNLTKVFSMATKENKQGLANLLADRIDVHNKHQWMVNSCLKGV